MIGIDCIAPIQTSNRFQVRRPRNEAVWASVKSQSGHFGASDSSSPAVTIRPSCTLSVASKILQLAIPSSPPIWPASSRSAQCSDLPSPAKTWSYAEEIVFSWVASGRRRDCFGSRANESHSRRSVGGRWASNPSPWAQFLVRAVAAEPSREKRRRKGWLPLAPAAQPRVRRRLPRVPRALAARPPRGRRAGQGRRQAQGH